MCKRSGANSAEKYLLQSSNALHSDGRQVSSFSTNFALLAHEVTCNNAAGICPSATPNRTLRHMRTGPLLYAYDGGPDHDYEEECAYTHAVQDALHAARPNIAAYVVDGSLQTQVSVPCLAASLQCSKKGGQTTVKHREVANGHRQVMMTAHAKWNPANWYHKAAGQTSAAHRAVGQTSVN